MRLLIEHVLPVIELVEARRGGGGGGGFQNIFSFENIITPEVKLEP